MIPLYIYAILAFLIISYFLLRWIISIAFAPMNPPEFDQHDKP